MMLRPQTFECVLVQKVDGDNLSRRESEIVSIIPIFSDFIQAHVSETAVD